MSAVPASGYAGLERARCICCSLYQTVIMVGLCDWRLLLCKYCQQANGTTVRLSRPRHSGHRRTVHRLLLVHRTSNPTRSRQRAFPESIVQMVSVKMACTTYITSARKYESMLSTWGSAGVSSSSGGLPSELIERKLSLRNSKCLTTKRVGRRRLTNHHIFPCERLSQTLRARVLILQTLCTA